MSSAAGRLKHVSVDCGRRLTGAVVIKRRKVHLLLSRDARTPVEKQGGSPQSQAARHQPGRRAVTTSTVEGSRIDPALRFAAKASVISRLIV